MQLHSFTKLAKTEWHYWLPLAVASFFGASLLMSGWPRGLSPEIQTPFIYAGDGFAYLWNIQRAIEGAWYFENARSGFPFGSSHLDYPTADTGSYLIVKLLGLFFDNAAVANLYFLVGFAICSAITYLVTRTLDLAKPYAVACAILYAFTTYHFARIGHLFLTAYFVAPLFFYLGFRIIAGRMILTNPATSWSQKLWNALGIMLVASFGIYYDFFGCIVIAFSILIAYGLHRSWRHVSEGLLTLAAVVLGLLSNVLPSLVYLWQNGESSEGVNRLAEESELYGLKITQLLLPQGDHRLDVFAEFASRYNNHFPLVTENISASMGSVASIGFLVLIFSFLIIPFSRRASGHAATSAKSYDLQVKLLTTAVLAIGLVIMGTVGGGSSLFAMLVSTSFRAWNRISIFIVFLSLLGLFVAIQLATNKLKLLKNLIPLYIAIASILVILGVYDQTVRPCHSCIASNKALANNDKAFIQTLETALPKQAAIYQLPYMPYSDASPVNGVGSYDQARGHLHSKDLRWSFGGVRGRVGDWFFRQLSKLPIEQQVVVVKSMGFAGIYVDKRGYLPTATSERCTALSKTKTDRLQNNCMTVIELEQDITNAIGDDLAKKSILSPDKQLAFFPIAASTQNEQSVVLANNYLAQIGFKLENGIPVQLEGGFETALDLRQEDKYFPVYISGVTGLSSITAINGQNVGRWSDAHVAKKITIWLSKPLPKSFMLQVRAQAGGPNVGKPVKVKVGKQIKEMVFGTEFSTQSLEFGTTTRVSKIELFPAEPFSPARRWGDDDRRVLAIQLEQLSIK